MRRFLSLLLCATFVCASVLPAQADPIPDELAAAFTDPLWEPFAPVYTYAALSEPLTFVVMEGFNQHVLCVLYGSGKSCRMLLYNCAFLLRSRPFRVEEADGRVYLAFPADGTHDEAYRFRLELTENGHVLIDQWHTDRADGTATTIEWPDEQWVITETAADDSVTVYPPFNFVERIVRGGLSWSRYLDDLIGYQLPALMDCARACASGAKARTPKVVSATADTAYIQGMYSSLSLNFRTEPNVGSECIGQYYGGTPVTILDDSSKNWCRVRIGDREGWLKRDYLCFGDDALQLVTRPPTAAVRADTPLLAADLQTQLCVCPADATVTVYGDCGPYVHVLYNDTVGFLPAEAINGGCDGGR